VRICDRGIVLCSVFRELRSRVWVASFIGRLLLTLMQRACDDLMRAMESGEQRSKRFLSRARWGFVLMRDLARLYGIGGYIYNRSRNYRWVGEEVLAGSGNAEGEEVCGMTRWRGGRKRAALFIHRLYWWSAATNGIKDNSMRRSKTRYFCPICGAHLIRQPRC
jgi:hypothetical protein